MHGDDDDAYEKDRVRAEWGKAQARETNNEKEI